MKKFRFLFSGIILIIIIIFGFYLPVGAQPSLKNKHWTPTFISTQTIFPIITMTVSPTLTNIFSLTPTQIISPTITSVAISPTITNIIYPTNTPTSTIIPSVTPTKTMTPSPTPTNILPTPTQIAGAKSYFVSINGNNNNPGSFDLPWRTIQKAANSMSVGDNVTIQAGDYAELVNVYFAGNSYKSNGKVTMRGFYVWGNNNIIDGFTITNPSSDFGIRTEGNNNLIENNDISNTMQDGIWFFGNGNRFTKNYIHDIVDRSKRTDDPHVDCFQTWGPAQNIIFDKNFCDHTSTYGSNQIVLIENIVPPVQNLFFKNNLFIMHDPGYSPMTFYRKDDQTTISDIYVINNTIVHTNGVGTYGIWFRKITNAYAINNLFIDYGYEWESYIYIDQSIGIQINNNAVYKSDLTVPFGGMFPTDIYLFYLGLTDISNFDFHPLSTSPIIDSGFYASSWVNDDFDDVIRPQGTNFDIGAFEYKAK